MSVVVKFLTVAIFAGLLYIIISFIMAKIAGAIDINTIAPTVRYYLCRFGIFQAVNIYVSLLIASWFTNKILEYFS